VLIYGAGKTGRLLAQHLLEEHHLGLSPAGFVDDDHLLHGAEVKVGPGLKGRRIPVVGGADELIGLALRTRVAAVFLALPSASPRRIAAVIARLEAFRVPFFCVPHAGDLIFRTLSFGQLAGMPVFTRRLPAASPVYDAVKRLIDVAGALALVVVTSPLLLLGAVLVRLTSSGPVLFRQQRVGLNGELFTIVKLRTMRHDAPVYEVHPTRREDPRVTAVGAWLRRFSVDELPQLWNVLRGEMSLVGPRPEMAFIVAKYDEIQRQRMVVKPGVTGLWQISADRAFRIHDNIHYDLHYVENRCLSLDLAIMLMTPFVLLARNRTA
jgi:exopolysaccharide biosynthesis polyprenyl glycosylphosphotransferase